MKQIISLAAAAIAAALLAMPSKAETLRVGRAVPQAFSFVPIDIGIAKGFFRQNGLDIQSYAFAGDAKLQQAMAADSLDIGVGSGPGMAFIAKGAPVKAVAAMAGPPLILVLMVRPDGPKSVTDLKNKRISVSTVGSLTYWLASETSRQQGWGPNGIDIIPMGAMAGQIAALERRDTDGVVVDLTTALQLAKQGRVRILLKFGNIVPDFLVHVIFATNKMIAANPDAIRSFLKGWFQTIAFMRANRAETVAISMKALGSNDIEIMNETYDELMPMFSTNGKFDPRALRTLAKSWVQLKVLPEEPDPKSLYTDAFLPPT